MNRTYFYAALTLAVLFTATIVFWHRLHPATNNMPSAGVSKVDTPTDSEKAVSSNGSTSGKAAPSGSGQAVANSNDRLAQMGITPGMTETQKMQKWGEWYVKEAARITAQHEHPIFFYGRTTDESNQPVAGATANLILSESPASPDGIVETNVQCDVNGMFSFTDAIGHMLEVSVYKKGYYSTKDSRVNFDYTTYQPNPYKPEIFHLRKKGNGTDLITSQYGMAKDFPFSTPLDGTPVRIDFFNRKLGEEGQMEIRAVKPDRLKQERASEWSFKISIPDGGFIEQNDEFPFEAPESGYQPTVEFHFKVGEPGWTETVNKSYYIVFGQPRKYGRIEIETQMYWGVRLTYAINPDGSRYLEPK